MPTDNDYLGYLNSIIENATYLKANWRTASNRARDDSYSPVLSPRYDKLPVRVPGHGNPTAAVAISTVRGGRSPVDGDPVRIIDAKRHKGVQTAFTAMRDARIAQRQLLPVDVVRDADPVGVCGNPVCGREYPKKGTNPGRAGRCAPCYRYLNRNARERPWDVCHKKPKRPNTTTNDHTV